MTLTVSCVGGDGGLDRQIPYADLCKEVRKFVNRILERLIQMEIRKFVNRILERLVQMEVKQTTT